MKNRGNGWGVDDNNNNNNNGNPGGEREREFGPWTNVKEGHSTRPIRGGRTLAGRTLASRLEGTRVESSMRKFRGSIPRENPLPPLLQFAWKKESQRDPRIICGEYPHDLF